MAEPTWREKVKSKVVYIKGSGPGRETICFMGTIILAEPQFCYVVVDRAMARNGFSYEATLPDGSMVPLVYEHFSVGRGSDFAAFYIYQIHENYDVNMIDAVEVGEQEVSRFDSVYVADFDKCQGIYFPGARVNDVEDHFFVLDWSTDNVGSPVFDEDGVLVGICYYSPLDPSFAYTMSAVKAKLLELSEEPVQTIEEFLDQVRSRS